MKKELIVPLVSL